MIEFGVITGIRQGEYVEVQVKFALDKTLWLTLLTWSDFAWEPEIGQIVACALERQGKGVVLGTPQSQRLTSGNEIARKGDTVQVSPTTHIGTITSGSSNGSLS